MASEPADLVLERVGEKLHNLSNIPSQFSIFRVPDLLRKVNEKAYEPEILAIGPYHRGKEQLMAFEEHKTRYLQNLLLRRADISLAHYVNAMRAMEEKVRKCYDGFISLDQDEFVEMMLLDGCFIVEVVRKFITNFREDNDRIFKLDWMLPFIARDMFLLENQLPFSVLWELFSMTEMPNYPMVNDFQTMILQFFYGILPGFGHERINADPIEEIKHIVGLIHSNWLPSPAEIDAYKINATEKRKWRFICCATELQEAGIKFQKVEGVVSLFDIKFENGVMKIPTLAIGDSTDTVFRNLIAYEQFSHDKHPNHVLDYVKFLDCLINSSKDAELLRRRGIIDNWLGDDEVIAVLINRLGDAVVLGDQLYYSEIFDKVNMHCSRRRNKWLAKLRHNYFNTPWAIISFLAAALLLLLTFLQALFAVLSYF